MAFVKLDKGILTSTLWPDVPAREVFLTAMLMAEPFEVDEPIEALRVRTIEPLGFTVPKGWYGFVHAAGIGIIRAAMVETDVGLMALERLASPDPESRTPDFEGRRLVRIPGGYLVLNYDRYRAKDHSTAERSRRYRAKKTAERGATRDGVAVTRDITQEYEDGYEDGHEGTPPTPGGGVPVSEATAVESVPQYPARDPSPIVSGLTAAKRRQA